MHISIGKLALCNNLSSETIISIFEIFNNHSYTHLLNHVQFLRYYIDIDVLKKIHEIISKYRIFYGEGRVISKYLDFIISNIKDYNDDMINDKIEELKKIINNLHILNYNSNILIISEFLCEYLHNNNTLQQVAQYKFILNLYNYIYYDLNLLDTVEFKDGLKVLLVKYKLV